MTMTIRVDSFIHSLSHSSSLSPPLPTRNNPPALDTLNTGAIEAAVGSYLQLAVLWACGSLLGVVHVPAALAFFEIAGWLSVLEHDRFVRELPFGLWKVEEHHMHHAFVKCNYGG